MAAIPGMKIKTLLFLLIVMEILLSCAFPCGRPPGA